MQLAADMGVRVLGTDRENMRAHVEAAGAALIDFKKEDVVERCRDLTGGRGVEAAFDGIGGTARASLKAVRRGGTLVWFGMVTMLTHGQRDLRDMVKTTATVASVFSPNLLPGGKRTRFYSIQMLARKHPDWYRQDLTALLTMLVEGRIDPRIAAVGSLDEVPATAQSLAGGALAGKQVIRVGGA
jgi:NADPH:quinone reductase-like Zn-dependent oxidoreductase